MNRRDLFPLVVRLSKQFDAEAADEFLDLIRNLAEEDNKKLEEDGINLGGFTFWRRGQTFFWQQGWNKRVQKKLQETMKRDGDIYGTKLSPRFYLSYRKEPLISSKESHGLLETYNYFLTEFGKMTLVTRTSTWSTQAIFVPDPAYHPYGPQVPDYRFFSVPTQDFYLVAITFSALSFLILTAAALIFS